MCHLWDCLRGDSSPIGFPMCVKPDLTPWKRWVFRILTYLNIPKPSFLPLVRKSDHYQVTIILSTDTHEYPQNGHSMSKLKKMYWIVYIYISFSHTHTHFSSSDNFRKPRLRHIEVGLAHRLLTRPFVLALKSAILKSWLVGSWAHPQPTRWIQMMQLAVIPKANHTQNQWRNVLNRPSPKYKVYGSLTKWTYDLSWWVLFDASIMQTVLEILFMLRTGFLFRFILRLSWQPRLGAFTLIPSYTISSYQNGDCSNKSHEIGREPYFRSMRLHMLIICSNQNYHCGDINLYSMYRTLAMDMIIDNKPITTRVIFSK